MRLTKTEREKINDMKNHNFEKMSEKELFVNYKKTKNLELRNFIIIKYMLLIKLVIKTILSKLPCTLEPDDAFSYGVFGLIDAIDKYDFEKNTQFNTYALYRIRGAIFDELRKYHRGHRRIYEKERKIKEITNTLEALFGRLPTTLEVANALNMNIENFYKLKLKIAMTHPILFTQLPIVLNGRCSLVESIESPVSFNPDVITEKRELKRNINSTVKNLPTRKRDLIIMRYYKNMTFTQISKIMGVSQPTVWVLHKCTMQKLKNDLKGVWNK